MVQATKRHFRIRPISSHQLTTMDMKNLMPITTIRRISMGSNSTMNGVNLEIQYNLRQVHTRIKIISIASPETNLRLIQRLAKCLS